MKREKTKRISHSQYFEIRTLVTAHLDGATKSDKTLAEWITWVKKTYDYPVSKSAIREILRELGTSYPGERDSAVKYASTITELQGRVNDLESRIAVLEAKKCGDCK